MIAQANFTLSKLGFRKKSYNRKTAKMVGLNSARNSYLRLLDGGLSQ